MQKIYEKGVSRSNNRSLLSGRLENHGGTFDHSYSGDTSISRDAAPFESNSFVTPIHLKKESEEPKSRKRRSTFVSRESNGSQHFHIVDENNFRIKAYARRNILFLRNVNIGDMGENVHVKTARTPKRLTLENKAPVRAEDVWTNHLLIPETPVGPMSPCNSEDGVFFDMFET